MSPGVRDPGPAGSSEPVDLRLARARARQTRPDPKALTRLMRLSAEGDQAALGALYDQTGARLYGLVLCVVSDPARAEEITREVFVDIWRTAGRFDAASGSAFSWVATKAHRRAVDWRRGQHWDQDATA